MTIRYDENESDEEQKDTYTDVGCEVRGARSRDCFVSRHVDWHVVCRSCHAHGQVSRAELYRYLPMIAVLITTAHWFPRNNSASRKG